MIEIVFKTHEKNMKEDENEGKSVGTYLRKHVQNMFKFKKL